MIKFANSCIWGPILWANLEKGSANWPNSAQLIFFIRFLYKIQIDFFNEKNYQVEQIVSANQPKLNQFWIFLLFPVQNQISKKVYFKEKIYLHI